MIWYDMIWYDMKWYDMIWSNMIWYDMMWHEMIWYVMKWYDMRWYEMIMIMIWYEIRWDEMWCDVDAVIRICIIWWWLFFHSLNIFIILINLLDLNSYHYDYHSSMSTSSIIIFYFTSCTLFRLISIYSTLFPSSDPLNA